MLPLLIGQKKKLYTYAASDAFFGSGGYGSRSVTSYITGRDVHKPGTRSTTGYATGSTYAWSTFSSTYVTGSTGTGSHSLAISAASLYTATSKSPSRYAAGTSA